MEPTSHSQPPLCTPPLPATHLRGCMKPLTRAWYCSSARQPTSRGLGGPPLTAPRAAATASAAASAGQLCRRLMMRGGTGGWWMKPAPVATGGLSHVDRLAVGSSCKSSARASLYCSEGRGEEGQGAAGVRRGRSAAAVGQTGHYVCGLAAVPANITSSAPSAATHGTSRGPAGSSEGRSGAPGWQTCCSAGARTAGRGSGC